MPKIKTMFSAGSSGIEMALGNYWNAIGNLQPKNTWNDPGEAGPLLVISGSCSPVTSAQIDWAVENGFAEIGIDTIAIANNNGSSSLNNYIDQAISYIEKSISVVIHTSRGNNDPRMDETQKALAGKGLSQSEISAETSRLYGTALGNIAQAVAAQTKLKRILIAGGDTSSFAARAMGVEAVEMIAPITPGAPLCRAYAPNSPVDGLELNFKGGQVGTANFFGMVQQGTANYKV